MLRKDFTQLSQKYNSTIFFSFVQTLFAALQCNSLAHHSQGVVGTAVGPNAKKNPPKMLVKKFVKLTDHT